MSGQLRRLRSSLAWRRRRLPPPMYRQKSWYTGKIWGGQSGEYRRVQASISTTSGEYGVISNNNLTSTRVFRTRQNLMILQTYNFRCHVLVKTTCTKRVQYRYKASTRRVQASTLHLKATCKEMIEWNFKRQTS